MSALLKKHGYAELKKVGEGSFGEAMLVIKLADKSKEVCKKMDLGNASELEAQDMIRESRLLSTLRHPYIVRYRNTFSNGKSLCILMEYCEGGDLSVWIKERRLTRDPFKEDLILRWITQALLALKYVHEQKVLHRDIKSSNLLLVKSENSTKLGQVAWDVKLGDFGIAKCLDSTVAHARTCVGTPYYLAPEVCQDKPYNWGSDIWSMGCVLYELCALHVPFEAESLAQLMQRICQGRVPHIPESYSKELRQVGGDMLTRNQNKRPSAALLLQMPLLQKCMQSLLQEEQSSSMAKTRGRSESCSNVRRRSFDSGDVRHRDTAGTFRVGDQVEYRAEVGSNWLPATVMGVNQHGCIRIDLLPELWLHQEDHATRVRPGKALRKPSSAGEPTPKACNMMSPLLNDNIDLIMGLSSSRKGGLSCLGPDSPARKRGPSPSFVQGVTSTPQKRRAAHLSPGPPVERQKVTAPYGQNPMRPSKEDNLPNLMRQSKENFIGMNGMRKRASLQPHQNTGMSKSPSCPSVACRNAGRQIMAC
jgi:NIMA (never in mitosis gene a)-related kinase